MSFDDITEALGSHSRRQVLLELVEHNPLSTTQFAESRDAQVNLFHNHLPKLDSLGYIVWDRDQGTVVKGPDWEEIEPMIRLIQTNDDALPPDTLGRISPPQTD